MARLVGLADVGLDLDDPSGDPTEPGVVCNEPRAEQLRRGVLGRPTEDPPVERPRGAQERG